MEERLLSIEKDIEDCVEVVECDILLSAESGNHFVPPESVMTEHECFRTCVTISSREVVEEVEMCFELIRARER